MSLMVEDCARPGWCTLALVDFDACGEHLPIISNCYLIIEDKGLQ